MNVRDRKPKLSLMRRYSRWMEDDVHGTLWMGSSLAFAYGIIWWMPEILTFLAPFCMACGLLMALGALMTMFGRWRGWARPPWAGRSQAKIRQLRMERRAAEDG